MQHRFAFRLFSKVASILILVAIPLLLAVGDNLFPLTALANPAPFLAPTTSITPTKTAQAKMIATASIAPKATSSVTPSASSTLAQTKLPPRISTTTPSPTRNASVTLQPTKPALTTLTRTPSKTPTPTSTSKIAPRLAATGGSQDMYLHGIGSNDNPSTLTINAIASTTTTVKFKDSTSINFTNGNPWKEIGTWSATSASYSGTLASLGDLHAWLGLKNSDDQGTNFDLRAEVYENAALVVSGETYCITSITRNPDLAKEAIVSFATFSPTPYNGTTDVLSIKILTRVGSDGSGSACGGHRNAVGLRLYFDAVSRPARFAVASANTPTPTATSTSTNTPTPTPPPDPYQLIEAAQARGEITLDQASLYKVYALFGSPLLPSQYQSQYLIPDEGTSALLYALKDWNQLSPATQQAIADFITPKQVTGGQSPQRLSPAVPTARRGLPPIVAPTPSRSLRLPPSMITPTPSRALRLPTVTPTPSRSARLMTPTPTASSTPASRVQPPKLLGPAAYHLRGVVQSVSSQNITWQTERGLITVRMNAQSKLSANAKPMTLQQLSKGDELDGIIVVEASGEAIAQSIRRFDALSSGTPNKLKSPSLRTALAPADWEGPIDLASGQQSQWPGTPVFAVDSAGNMVAVWLTGDYWSGGIWYSVKPAGSAQWSYRQHFSFTNYTAWRPSAWRPSVAIVNDQVYLTWEESYDVPSVGWSVRIRYIHGTVNGMGITWDNPIALSTPGTGAYRAALSTTTLSGQVQLHVVWTEVTGEYSYGDPYRIMYTAGSPSWNLWSSPTTIVEDANLQEAGGSASGGVVGIAYTLDTCDNNSCVPFYYTECDIAVAGNCSSGGWSGQQLYAQMVYRPALTLDGQGNAHATWIGHTYAEGFSVEYWTKSHSGSTTSNTVYVANGYFDFDPFPIIAASGPGNVYVAWNEMMLNPPELRYARYDGSNWSSITMVTNSVSSSDDWGQFIIDAGGVNHLIWEGANGQIYYSASGVGNYPTRTPTRTATPTATLMPTATPTNTPVPTATPTVTPNSQLARDVAGCTLDRQDATSAHFVIWYTTVGDCAIQGATPNVYLDALKRGLEQAYDKYGTGAIYYNGDGLHYKLSGLPSPYQVYVVPMRVVTISGITFPLPAGALTLPSNIFMPNGFNVDLSSVAAHEFFHSIQWTYQPCWTMVPVSINMIFIGYWAFPTGWPNNEDLRWWMESTAQWAQHETFQNDASYTDHIPAHFNQPWIHMDTRPVEGGTGIPYSPLFPFYLIEKLNPGQINKDFIRSTWAQYQSNGNCGPMKPVLDSLLPQGKKIADIFPDYAEANYFLGYPPPPDIRMDLRTRQPLLPQDFRPVFDSAFFNDMKLGFAGPNNYAGSSIERLGAAYVEFTKGFSQPNLGRSLDIAVQIPVRDPSKPPIVRVWIVDNNFPPPPNSPSNSIPVTLMNISGVWNGSVTLPNFDSDQTLRVVMLIVNPQPSGANIEWTYQGIVR